MPLELERPEWQHQAACRGVGPDVFYGDGDTGPARLTPWTLCERCPVRGECLAQVLADERNLPRTYRFGLWAFTTPTIRQQLEDGELYATDGRHCGSVKGYQMHMIAGQAPCQRCQRKWEWYVDERRGEVTRLCA
jgi:WhiB family transcriptional regulator, redox-sensing transcriptional regulator